MAKSNTPNKNCPMDVGLNLLSGKWKLSILWYLSKETLRFNELKRKLKTITQKSLSLQIHELESDGLISRKSYHIMKFHQELNIPLLSSVKRHPLYFLHYVILVRNI